MLNKDIVFRLSPVTFLFMKVLIFNIGGKLVKLLKIIINKYYVGLYEEDINNSQ